MNHLPIDKSKDPTSIRLFKSDFLEFFTHISPIRILILWVPVTSLLLLFSVRMAPTGMFPWHIPAAFVTGMVLWTLGEYTLHRFLFHHEAKSEKAKRLFFLFHGVHHAQPQDKTRLVMPFPVSIPLALIFYGLFSLVLGVFLHAPLWVNPLTAGFMVGYLIYDLIHYATHHFPMRRGYGKYIKRYHMAHHYKAPDTRYGVSSPVWDWVFQTARE
jgi:sterol desaturase/sphingolipid hydroxylase (fatty acid hydroxylase superfamily)